MAELNSETKSLVGRTIGGYRIERYVGKGGMGTVYRAVQISLDRVVALKILSPQLVADPAFVELFFREARSAGKLNHPNVVQVYDVGEQAGIYFYSMEFMEGGTLEARIQREGKIPLEEAVAIVRDAARGLQFAEAHKLVHRDIKPDNLMISAHGHAKIADLGLAAAHKTSEGRKGKVLGTPHFISPEQARGGPVDARSDLYSLGATFFRILTGKTPFTGRDVREIVQKHLKEEAPLLRTIDPEIPEEIEATVATLLQKDPAKRCASASELADALDAFLTKRAHSGARAWILAGIPVLLLGAALLVWKPWRKPEPTVIEKIVREADPAKAQENERMRREILEKDAKLAYQGVAADLAPDARAGALEKVAGSFAGTEYGRVAAEEAEGIRRQVEAEVRAAKAREERLARLEVQLRGRVQPLLDGGRFAEAAKTAASAPETADPGWEGALSEKILEEIRQAEKATLWPMLEEAKRLLLEGEFGGAEEKLRKVRDSLTPAQGLPETIAASFERDLAEAQEALRAVAAARTQREKEIYDSDLASVYGELFASSTLAEDLAAFRFSAASVRVRSLRERAASAAYRSYLDSLEDELGRLEKLMTALVRHVQEQTLVEKSLRNPQTNRPQALIGASREEGLYVQDPARRDSRVLVSWDRFASADRLFELWNGRWAMSGEEWLDAALLLLQSGTALEARNVEKQLVALREERPLEKPPAFDGKVFQLAKELVSKGAAAGGDPALVAALRERIQREEEAAVQLGRALQHFASEQFEKAAEDLAGLRERSRNTLLFGLFTDGSTHLASQ